MIASDERPSAKASARWVIKLDALLGVLLICLTCGTTIWKMPDAQVTGIAAIVLVSIGIGASVVSALRVGTRNATDLAIWTIYGFVGLIGFGFAVPGLILLIFGTFPIWITGLLVGALIPIAIEASIARQKIH